MVHEFETLILVTTIICSVSVGAMVAFIGWEYYKS
jgi:hypothetical protein